MRYCGRTFSDEELDWIRSLLDDGQELSRRKLSERICRHLDWRKPDGKPKAMSCRVALLRMEKDGLLALPPAKGAVPRPGTGRQTALSIPEPQRPVRGTAGELALSLELVKRKSSARWNELIERHHYLGYSPLPGAQLRYFVNAGGQLLALLGFGAAAWKTAPRDRWIGWSDEQRRRNLHLVVGNARFLILPWVQVRYLASRVLGMVARRIADDWQARYAYRPVLLETFVEKDRFEGTCYKAAGWSCVGETKGRGKLDVRYECKLPKKTVWLRPLERGFRRKLLA